MIASGRRPVAPPASTIGSTGSTHGESAVTSPATKPIRAGRASPGNGSRRDYAGVTFSAEPRGGRRPRRSRTACAGDAGAASGLLGGASPLLARRALRPFDAAEPSAFCCCSGARAALLAPAPRRDLRVVAFGAGQVVGERVRDRPVSPSSSRARSSALFARGVYPSAEASSAAPTSSGIAFATWTSRATFSSCRCPREFATAPSRRFASGNSALARRSWSLRVALASRHVQRWRIWSGAFALPSPIARSRIRTPAERSLSHGGAWVTRVTRSSKSARSTGHRDAVLERGHAQAPVRVLGGADREERLERGLRGAALGELLRELGALVEADLPAGDRRPVALLVLVEVLRDRSAATRAGSRRAGARRPA